jgi:hypothetical protein
MPFIGNAPARVPLTSADITDGIITSAKIVDGTIVNADINASAAIDSTKLSGVSSKFVKATLAYNNSTRTVYSSSKVVVTGQDFAHPTNAAQTISFTKDSATSNIVIHYSIHVGEAVSQHAALLWSTADNVYRHIGFDGSRNGISDTVDGSDALSGVQFFSGLSAGSKTFYITLGRNDDGENHSWILNTNLNDNGDKSLTPTSQVIVYEIEP